MSADLLILQRTEQLGLHRQGGIAKFIQEQDPVVCMLKQAHSIALRAGKGSFDVTEEFALEQGFDDRRTVEIHEPAGTHRAQPVQRAGHEFLARPRRSGYQRGAEVGSYSTDSGEQILHQGALADHSFKAMGAEDFAFQFLGFMPPCRFRGEPADTKTEVRNRNRLGQVVACAFLNRFQGRLGGIVACHQQDFGVGASFDDGFQQLHSVASRQNQVEYGDIGLLLEDEFKAFIRIRGRQDLDVELGQRFGNELQRRGIIVNSDKCDLLFVHFCSFCLDGCAQYSMFRATARPLIG
jgi:hypothetical protein